VAGRSSRFETLVLTRALWSDATTAAPAAATTAIAFGDDEDAVEEVRVFLGEALREARPPQLFRHLLPAGTKLVTANVSLTRADVPPKLATPITVAITAIVVPDTTDEGTAARGHWVFIPVLGHTFYAERGEDIEPRLISECARVVDAAALEPPAWKRLLPAAAHELVPIEVDVAATPADAATSKRALVDAERRRKATETLDAIGTRVEPSPEGPRPLVGRAKEIASLASLLDGRERLSVLLVGDEGVGKTALLHAWADRAARRPLWMTSTAQLVAGASGLGEWQERVASVLDAAELLDAVLYLDDFGALFADRPEEGGFHVASLLRRWVTGNRARVIGELTAAQLDRGERREVALCGAMTRVRVEPLDVATTITVCRDLARAWARTERTRPIIDDAAVPMVIELARRYLPYRAFPGKAVRFLDELRAVHDGERAVDGTPRRLGVEEVYEGFSLVTGIPAFLLRDDRALLVEQVVARFRRRLIGQEEAVRRVAETICVVKAQLQPADKPLATFLFVGPTGVGKTELAKSLAHLLFGAEDRLVRFDMSEYTDPWAAERLIRGTRSGDGLLTAKVREQPFCVLLLDEIEKAHPSVFDLLLQVTGEGRLTDARGRTTYFHNAIIIMTSNLGTRGGRAALGIAAGDPIDRDRAAELDRYRDAVTSAFRPEFVGRIDRVIAFHRLRAAEVAEVARLAIAKLGERRGLAQAGVALDVSASAAARIAEGGHSPAYGVRALRRHIEQFVIAPASRLLAAVGAEGHGGMLIVRAPDEADHLPAGITSGSRLGTADGAELAIRLYRRSAAGGKRALRGALAVGELRRATDRDLVHALATAVRDQITWINGQLATAIAPAGKAGKQDKKKREALSAQQIQAMHVELARLGDAWMTCTGYRDELRATEELVLHALAAGEDADDIAETAGDTRARFRRAYFWLLVSRLEKRDAIALVAHGPDHAAGLVAWTRAILDACEQRGWNVTAHLRPSEGGGDPIRTGASWGGSRTPAQLRDRFEARADDTRSILLRVRGNGCALLLGLEAGLHRFHGIARVDPCHVIVEAAASFVDFSDVVWASPLLQSNRPTSTPKQTPARTHTPRGDSTMIDDVREVEIPFAQYAARLEEIAVEQILHDLARDPDADLADQWTFTSDGAGA